MQKTLKVNVVVTINLTCFSDFLIRTTKSSQHAVDGFLLPTPRNISSEVTFCLNKISYLEIDDLKTQNMNI